MSQNVTQCHVISDLICYTDSMEKKTEERKEIFCPTCAIAGIKRKLMEVDSQATGIIYPYCKACKKNVRIDIQEYIATH